MKGIEQEATGISKIFSWLRTAIGFLRRCFYFAALDALSAAFGWATIINAAALVYVGGRLGVTINSGQSWPSILLYASACFAVGLMIAFAINFLVVAPVKAWRFMRPLVVNITGDDRSPDYTFNETIRGYNSTVIVRNRSHVHLVDCTAHVVGQISPLGFKEDRFIEKFTLPPQSRKAIYVTRWFSRESPHTDDKVIFLNGPIGGLNGNINDVASEGAELRIKIHAPGVETIFIRCRVWVDRESRRLMTLQLP